MIGRVRFFGAVAVYAAVVAFAASDLSAGPVSANYSNPNDVPIQADGFNAQGKTLDIALNFPPKPGADLTVIRNSGPIIHGTFANVAHGQTITLSYAGLIFKYVADYHGGAGKDLVLHWTTDGDLTPAALSKLDPQLLLALKQVRSITPFDKTTSLRPQIPVRDGDRALVELGGSISNDLLSAITAAGGEVVPNFVTPNSARAMVPVAQLEQLAGRPDVTSISATKLSVTSKLAP